MPNAAPLHSSFTTGEVSPLMQGNVSNPRVKAGLGLCLNYVPTIQGGLLRRPGSYFVGAVKDSTKKSRLIPFEFSTTQAYIIEFADQALRFYKNNTPILEVAQALTAITKANPGSVHSVGHGLVTGQQVELAGIVGMTELNGRRVTITTAGVDDFTIGIDTTAFTTYVSGGTYARVYTVVTPYLEADLYQLKYTQSADVIYVTHPKYAPRKISRTGHTAWTVTTIDLLDGPYLPRQVQSNGSKDTSVTMTVSALFGTVALTSSAAVFAATDVGRYVRFEGGTGAGHGKIVAFTNSSQVSLTIDGAYNFPVLGPTTAWRMGVWSDTTGYPGTVTFHEDRLWFAGASNFPERIDSSCTADYENFGPTTNVPVYDPVSNTNIQTDVAQANNALSFTLSSNDVNLVRWMTSDEKGLLIGTVGGEWVLRPSSFVEAITPTNVSAKRASSWGSADVQPVVLGKAAMYMQRAGKKLRELTYFYDVDGFQANDMTFLSEHITGTGVTQLAVQREPHAIVWAVRSDGTLAAMTYERDVESLKAGWSRHILGGVSDANGTQAIVESAACIPSQDGTRDELYVIVRRWVNGVSVRYVEYVTPFFDDLTDQEDAFFVDCGLTYDGSPATVMSGIFHLEGQRVDILADGAIVPSAVVANGKITLSKAASVVNIGLNVVADGQLLRDEAGSANGTALGKTRRTHRVGFYLHNTLGFKFGMSFDDLEEITFRTSSNNGDQAVPLFSGIHSETLPADYDFDNMICFRQNTPLPGLILAVMPQLVTNDRI